MSPKRTTVTKHDLLATISEADFQDAVIQTAHLYRWKVHHTRPAMRKDGTWSTPLQGDKGWPDLAMAKAWESGKAILILAELKAENAPAPVGDQAEWMALLGMFDGVLWLPPIWGQRQIITRVWRPSDQREIDALLMQ